MLKKIRKSLKYFIIVIGVILLLPTALYLLLQTSGVQTLLVKKITSHFSNEFKTTISIGSIEYIFFNKLSINNILIKDKNNDTLLYSKEITAGIRRINIKSKSFSLGRVNLIKPVIYLITDSTGQMNLSWYLDQLKTPSDTIKKSSSRFSVDQIDIIDARFSLINRSAAKGKTRLDFNNLNLYGVNGIIEELKILNDATTFSIYNLGFKESCGFLVKRMNGAFILAGHSVLVNTAYIRCDSSEFNIPSIGLIADSSNAFKNFTEKVKLDVLLDKSLISFTDLKYFIPVKDSLDESVVLSGKILGTISELRGRNINLSYRNFTSLDCDFDFSGLPNIENTFLYVGVNNLRTNAKDLEEIKINGKDVLEIPDPLKKLGNISFNGSFTGFITDFVTYGEIRTSQGNIRTDISLRPEAAGKYKIKGLLNGSDINIGELTGNTKFLGNLSFKTNVDGYASSFKKFAGNITGKIDSIEINKYKYRNISLNGLFTEKTWDGSIKIADNNINLELLGLLNFNAELPEFDFTLNVAYANLYKLNFDKLDSTSNAKLLLTSNFKGNSIDNLDGEIKLLNSSFTKYNNKLELYDLSITTFKEDNNPGLSLQTDFIDAKIEGYYNFAAIGSLIKSTLVTLMPSQFQLKGKQNDFKKNKFTFIINFKNTDKINSFFRTGISISDKSYLKGAVFADSSIHIDGKANFLTVKNNVFKDFSIDADYSGSELTVDINNTSLTLLGQSELKDFSVALKTKPDNFTFKINWDNKEQILNRGNFSAQGTVAKNATGKRNTVLKIDIDSSRFYSENNLWKLSNSSILIDSTAIKVHRLYITSNDRSWTVDGTVSENPSDTLHLEFKGIDISPVNHLLNRKKVNDPDTIPFDFKGILNGKILCTNVYRSLLLAGNITVNNFSVLGSEFGNIYINSDLDNTKKRVNLNASNDLNSIKTFDASGFYDPSKKKIDVTVRTAKLPVGFLNPLLKVFASDISGFASGNLNISGETENLVLKGAVKAENVSMKINFLQTIYTLNDTIRFDKNLIKFSNVQLTDIKGNLATLSGSLYHKSFKDYSVDLIFNLNSPGFQVLNTQPKDNEMFYGTAFASGVAKIKSDQKSLAFNISAKTGKNTKLSIPLNKGLSASEYSFITFVDSVSIKKQGQPGGINSATTTAKQVGLDLNMNLEITPDAEIQIIFDSKTGDVMKGHGSSENLNIYLNKKGDFGISGDYYIEDGDYTFTLANILNKTFSVENGGKIMFSGDLKDAEIDLKANYLNLKTSLEPVLGPEYTEKIPVEPQLSLSGKLFNPIVGFDIDLPDADEQTKAYLHSQISTQEELTRQVFALLLMNSFISVGALNSTAASGGTAISASTLEMVSNQISNWLSQISKDVDIGLNIDPQETQLALSTQVFNDKVVLNSNFDVRGTDATTNSNNTNHLTGDFDAEVRITEKLKFKVFNRFSDNTYTGLSPYTQGVGIFYKQDFNRVSDLFRKKTKPDMKKEEETKAKDKRQKSQVKSEGN